LLDATVAVANWLVWITDFVSFFYNLKIRQVCEVVPKSYGNIQGAAEKLAIVKSATVNLNTVFTKL